MNDFTKFLINAKKQTYANGNALRTTASRLDSKDYEYQEGEMIYHDTYFGGTKFIGEEIVYDKGTKIWGMNYYGVTLDATLSEEVMDNVLRPALSMVGEDKTTLPLRGPSKFENNSFTYTFICDGDLDNFTGTEEIYKNNKLIYKLHCHGGVII